MIYHLSTMSLVDFSSWLQDRLDERGWRPTDLAKQAKMSDTAISRFIQGARKPDSKSLNAIAKALKLPPDQVFRAAGQLPQKPETDERIERVIHEMQDLNDQEKDELLAYINMRKNLRKKK